MATLTSSALAVGMLWTSVAVDWLGLVALVGGAVVLVLFSVVIVFATRHLAEWAT